MRVQDAVAFVTGGASGLGEATVRNVVDGGGRAVIVDRPSSNGATVAKALGDRALFAPADVTSEAEVQAALDAAVGRFGAINVAVNCAGIGTANRTVTKTGPFPLELFELTIKVNLIGTFNVLRLACTAMNENEPDAGGERGVCVNTASIAAYEGQIGQVAYSAAKAGIAGMCLTMARDLGSLGIRVMAIAPSLFATGITQLIPEAMAEALTRDAAFPKRMGKPEEYARLAQAIFETPMLNGNTIRLDGGQRFAPK
jgi:NAD(P)-dependent dehydrogenase (short-subunit alcohol dehydrogenase family)